VNTTWLRWSAITFVSGLFILLSSGCVVAGGGYGYDDGASIGVDYYAPLGGVYGGWGPGYGVAPVRGGYRRPDGGRSSAHAYRSAPAGRSMPSIPSGGRSGGSRSR